MTSINCALMASKIPILLSISFSRRAGLNIAAAGYYTFKRAEGFEHTFGRTPCATKYCIKKGAMEAREEQAGRRRPELLSRFNLPPRIFQLFCFSPTPERVKREHGQAARHVYQAVVDRG